MINSASATAVAENHTSNTRCYWRALLVGASLGITACAGPVVQTPPISEHNTPLAACESFYRHLDNAAQEAQVIDARAQRVSGAPYLRVSRFLASFEPDTLSPEAYASWLGHLNVLANQGLTKEWHRLPTSQQEALRDYWPNRNDDITQTLTDCGQHLVQHLTESPRISALEAQDHYQTWKRFLGLYPVVALPFRWGVVREHRDIANSQERHQQLLQDEEALENWQRFAAPGAANNIPRALEALRRSESDALGIPELDGPTRRLLLEAFAPSLAIEEAGPDGLASNDRPLLLTASTEGQISGDHSRPTLYTEINHGRYQNGVTTLLSYSVWFSERRPTHRLDLLAGQFNGVTWRVHLTDQGEVLGYDKMHLCGCWYQFYPAAGFQALPDLPFLQEPFYLGTSLEPHSAHTLWLEANTHSLLGVSERSPQSRSRALALREYNELRALPDSRGGYHSPFDAEGLIPESSRPERYLYWPMGVANTGALRIHGTHAIAFVGRRHFDDPWLLDELNLTRTAPNADE
ncbi:hypothetical protein [Marinimicrobium sp. ABcell2]|uniref:hypothetical protein n=1 Tax=Marinimicrobium sp. ABcell2 TaxID=3069751 RepID=UPI0027B81A16|nr:hypothetical protein [Marinimicrobium sp. ABcell2]MDQ2077881.1 hypothetical protein [Marinimicrobium sp. ABcell2]